MPSIIYIARLTESSTVRFPEIASKEVDDKMSEIISKLSVDWSTVSFAALTTLPSSFIMRPAVSAVIVSYDKIKLTIIVNYDTSN